MTHTEYRHSPPPRQEQVSLQNDPVNNPDHYTRGGVETIAFLEAKLSPEEFSGFLKGNVLKYLSRAGHKSDEIEDLKKARWYLDRLIQKREVGMFRAILGGS